MIWVWFPISLLHSFQPSGATKPVMHDSPGTPTSPLLPLPLAHSSPVTVSWLVTGFMAGYCYGLNCVPFRKYTGFPGGSVVKNPPANPGDPGLIPGSGRCPGEGNGTPLQYSCLENPTEEPGGLQSMGSQKSQTHLSD